MFRASLSLAHDQIKSRKNVTNFIETFKMDAVAEYPINSQTRTAEMIYSMPVHPSALSMSPRYESIMYVYH